MIFLQSAGGHEQFYGHDRKSLPNPKKTVMIHTTIRMGMTMESTMPVTVLQAMIWNRKVFSAHITIAMMKSGSDPDNEMPILAFRRVTSSIPAQRNAVTMSRRRISIVISMYQKLHQARGWRLHSKPCTCNSRLHLPGKQQWTPEYL